MGDTRMKSLSIETIKTVSTYAIAAFVVVYGMQVVSNAAAHQLDASTGALIGGMVMLVLQFITGSEIATRTGRSIGAAAAAAAGAQQTAFSVGATTAPTVTAQAPSSMTVTPTPAPGSDEGEGG